MNASLKRRTWIGAGLFGFVAGCAFLRNVLDDEDLLSSTVLIASGFALAFLTFAVVASLTQRRAPAD